MVLLKDLFEEAMDKHYPKKSKKSKKHSFKYNKHGLFRVCKIVSNRCRKNYTWKYSFRKNYRGHAISAVNLIRLKEKVLEQDLPWVIVDEELARQAVESDGLDWDLFVSSEGESNDSLDDDKSESLKELGIVKEGYVCC